MKNNCQKSVNNRQNYKQKRDCFVHFVYLLAVCFPGVQSACDNQALASPNLPDIHRFKKNFHCHTQVFCILGAARPLQVFVESHVRGGGAMAPLNPPMLNMWFQ